MSYFWCIDYNIGTEVLNELHRSQESAYNLRDAARQSYFNRGKLCSKILKYPHIEDYTVSLLRSLFASDLIFGLPIVACVEGAR